MGTPVTAHSSRTAAKATTATAAEAATSETTQVETTETAAKQMTTADTRQWHFQQQQRQQATTAPPAAGMNKNNEGQRDRRGHIPTRTETTKEQKRHTKTAKESVAAAAMAALVGHQQRTAQAVQP